MRAPAATLAEAARRLEARFGAAAVLTTPAEVTPFLGDMMCREEEAPAVVFRPASARMLSEGLRALADLPLDFVPRGGGSGLAGGATPGRGRPSVIVSTERMRTIVKIDRAARLMVAEAGVVLADAQAAAEAAGLHLGLTHGGAGSASLGGSVATNAGGNNVLRYGMARDQILGIEAVLTDGTRIGNAAELWKDNSGYALGQVIAGSEGTLAFVTAVALKLRAGVLERKAALFAVASPEDALSLLDLAHEVLGEAVSAAELVSGSALHFAQTMGTATPLLDGAPDWMLLIEAERTSPWFDLPAGFDALLEAAFERDLVQDGIVAQSEGQRRSLWALREGIPEAMDLWRGAMLRTDCAVPVGRVPDFVARTAARIGAHDGRLHAVYFGHLGDGNIHLNAIPPEPAAPLPDQAGLAAAIEDVAIALGGTISAEHGIGLHKRHALARMKPEAELMLMERIKQAFDPAARLNPDKILLPRAGCGQGAPDS